MIQATVTIVYNTLPDAPRKLEAATERRIQASAFRTQAEAQSLAPVDTGALKASILAVILSPLSAAVRAAMYYAIYVEMGTRKMAAQPYLRPALEREAPRLVASFHGIEAELA